jgi:phage-related protein
MSQPSIYDIEYWGSKSSFKKNEIVEYPKNSFIYYYALKDHTRENSDITSSSYDSTKWSKGETTLNNVTEKYFIWEASYGSTLIQSPRLKIARFGLGIEHRAQDGINTNLNSYQFKFMARDLLETNAIVHFLHERSGVEAFIFEPPKPFKAKKMYTCEEWEVTSLKREHFDITATFNQVKPEPYELILQ